MMHPDRARRIAAEMKDEAAHLRKLGANCRTEGAREWFEDRAAMIERKAASLIDA